MAGAELRVQREAVVREHMESENRHDFDTTIATFGHPRYELVATGDVYDGEDAVRAYFAESRRAFPDQRNELIALRMSAHFVFEGDQLVCERVYFDQLSIMRQLGLAHESTSLAGRVTTLLSHPLTVGRALARRALRRRA